MSSSDHVHVRIGHQMRSRLLIAAALLALAATLGACSGSDPEPTSAGSGGEIPGGADPADARVSDEWATALSEGDLEGAAEYFAIPSVAENGPVLIEIRELGDARAFNASLPCGAELVRAAAQGDFVVATFELTERPGPGACGTGTGGTARTAFVIEDGEIVEWRRVGSGSGGERAPSRSA